MKLVLSMFLVFSASVSAAVELECGGNVESMIEHSRQCGGYMAFKTTKSESTWICSQSEEIDGKLLFAYRKSKKLEVYLANNSGLGSCNKMIQDFVVSKKVVFAK